MKTTAEATAASIHKKRSGLRCHRCDGLMLPERLYDQMPGFGPMDCWGWRCIVCGELVDSLILRHHHTQTAPRRPELHHQAV